MRGVAIAVLVCGAAAAQQVHFTSRASLESPVAVASVHASKEYGFYSLTLRNDGPDAVAAVYLRVTLRSGEQEEIADERRVGVMLEPRGSKDVVVAMGHIEGLRQLTKTRRQTDALAVLTVERVEFAGGREWRATPPQADDAPLPVRVPK